MPFIGVLSFLGLVVWVYSLVDCATTPSGQARYFNKWLWFALIALLSFVGAVAWLLLGKPRRVPAGVAGAGQGVAEPAPEPEAKAKRKPRRPRTLAPDDDPDFLKKLDEITELEKQAREDDADDERDDK